MFEGSSSASIPPHPRSRLAPTPSGYLHRGNLYSFLLTWLAVRRREGSLHLRIDDMDSRRRRPEYVEDIFRCLEFFGLDWDTGPGGPGDLEKRWSQRCRMETYRDFLEALKGEDLVFPCTCTRREIRRAAAEAEARGEAPRGGCLGGCPRAGRPAAWRLRTSRCPGGASLPPELQECILWRKDAQPAYQLTSVADDEMDGITWIVRGEDLADSTRVQACLAWASGREIPPVLYHRLVRDGVGRKLSKSVGNSYPGDRTEPGWKGLAGGSLIPPPGEVSVREAEALRRNFLRGFCRWAGGEPTGGPDTETGSGASLPADLLDLPEEVLFGGELGGKSRNPEPGQSGPGEEGSGR